ncbi:MAG: hypothetical protein ACJ75I_01515 [Solirubrobacterales bacterium]
MSTGGDDGAGDAHGHIDTDALELDLVREYAEQYGGVTPKDTPESGVGVDGDLNHCVWHGRIFPWEDHLIIKGALRGLGLSGENVIAAGLREWAMAQESRGRAHLDSPQFE